MVKKEDYCLNANVEMLKIASLPNMDYATFVKRAAREFDWYESDGRQRNDGNFKPESTLSPRLQSIGALIIKTAPTPRSPPASRSLRGPWMGKVGRSLISEVFMTFLVLCSKELEA